MHTVVLNKTSPNEFTVTNSLIQFLRQSDHDIFLYKVKDTVINLFYNLLLLYLVIIMF